MIAPDLAAIPTWLTDHPRWVAWREVSRKRRKTKIPLTSVNTLAQSNNPTTWSSFEPIAAAIQQQPAVFDGVGFNLGTMPNGEHAGGFDFDTCLDENGDIQPWAQPIVACITALTYTEVSPSETGLKSFFRCKADDAAALRMPFGIEPNKWGNKCSVLGQTNGHEHPPAIETYLGPGRYFTVTGRHWATSPEDVALLDRNALLRVAELVRKATGGSKSTTGKPGRDNSRSAKAFRIGAAQRRLGASFEDMCAAIHEHPETATWYTEKGEANDARELKKIWDKTAQAPWLEHCQKNNSGRPISNLANIMIALREAPELRELVAFDEMLQEPALMKAAPSSMQNIKPRQVRDDDVAAIQEWLQVAGIVQAAKDTVHQGVDLYSRSRSFHPVRDYLNSVKWDGEERLETWLSKYLGVEDSKYASAIGTMFLISMVARVIEPGCKVDYMPILEGPQGALKSSACAILAGEWFSDHLPELRGADQVRVSQHLRGKWLIEVPEMHSMSKAEANELKAFLSRPVEKFTPKFGRREVIEPRQCVFIGTTNKEVYLRDETGGRRYWPAKVGEIDLELLQSDRDQLFAEAVHLYRKKWRWWPTRGFEEEHMKPQQAARYEGDPWEGPIATWLANKGKKETTFVEVATQALFMATGKIGTSDQHRMRAVFKTLGWVEGPRTNRGRVWVPVAAAAAKE
ncbi:MAG: VapE domain-containing protein [Acetobacteraceae bacterium]|jgi:predicted P-loop ATPase